MARLNAYNAEVRASRCRAASAWSRARAVSWLVSAATIRKTISEKTSCGLLTVNVKIGSTKQKS